MKTFLVLLLACFSVSLFGQGLKITDLPAASAVTTDDLLMIVNDPAGTPANQKITTANFKASIYASPVFTGVPTIPTPFTLGAVSVTATGTEMNYLVGVTSAIQTQLNNRQATNANLTLLQAFGPTQWQSTNANLTLLQAFGPTQWQSTNATLTRIQGIGAGVTGDVLYRDATGWTNLAKAADGTVLKLTSGFPAWGAVSGTGDVVGPSASTDNAITRFDSTTGKLIQNSVGLLSDVGALTAIESLTVTNAVTAGSFASVGSGVGALTLWDADGDHHINYIANATITTDLNWISPAAPETGLLLGTLSAVTNETISFSSGASTTVLVGGGAGSAPVWTTATGTGAPARAADPIFTSSLQLPNGAAPTTDAFGEISGDNNAWAASRGAVQWFDGTANTWLVGTLASDTPSNGQIPTWNTGGTITWETPSGVGGGETAGTVHSGTDLSVDNALVRVDGTGGTNVQKSVVLLSDVGALTAVESIAVTNGVTAGSIAAGATNMVAALSLKAPLQNGQRLLTTNPGAADDTWAGTAFSGLNNSGGVTQWDAVYLNGSSQWILADANGSGTYPCRGLATSTQSTGVATVVIEEGVVRNDAWTWTPGGTIYLSVTAGGLTQTAPATTGDKVQGIGYAIDADTMRVKISADYGTAP